MDEVWVDVTGYEGLYQVSNLGRVKSFGATSRQGWQLKERILKQTVEPKGYAKVGIRKDGKLKTVRVHRLVAEAFIPNPYEFPEVNHKDENKANNRVENLEWCSSKYNCRYGTKAKRAFQTMTQRGTCGLRWYNKTYDDVSEKATCI